MLLSLYTIRMVSFGFVNYVYIIVEPDTKKAAIVDPGWNYGKITGFLDEMGVEFETILLTHSHFDHTNLAGKLAENYNVKVYMSGDEIDASKFRCKNLYRLDDNDSIALGNTNIFCMSTPGHTEGSMCFLTDALMLSGDTVFMEGCGICQNEESAKKMYFSIQRIKNEVNRKVKVYAGHCYQVKNGCDLEWIVNNNIYFSLDNIEDFVKFRLRKRKGFLGKFS